MVHPNIQGLLSGAGLLGSDNNLDALHLAACVLRDCVTFMELYRAMTHKWVEAESIMAYVRRWDGACARLGKVGKCFFWHMCELTS